MFNKSVKKYGGVTTRAMAKAKLANKSSKNKSSNNKSSNNKSSVSKKKRSPDNKPLSNKKAFDERIKKMCFDINDVFDAEPFKITDEKAIVKFRPPRADSKASKSFCFKRKTFEEYVRHRLKKNEDLSRIEEPSSGLVLWSDKTLHKILNEIYTNVYRVQHILIDNNITTIKGENDIDEYWDNLHEIITKMKKGEDEEVCLQKFVATLGQTQLSDMNDEIYEETMSALLEMIWGIETILDKMVVSTELREPLSKRLKEALHTFYSRISR
jgi:hypothetical protein